MLEHVTSYEDFSRELTRFRRENRPCYTNCYLYGAKLRELIERGQMYVKTDDGCLSLFQDEGSYYEYYYYVRQDAAIPRLSLDKLATLWLVKNVSRPSPDIDRQREKLLNAGFQYVVDNIQISASLKEAAPFIQEQCAALEERMRGQPFQLEFFQTRDYPELLEIWQSAFRFYRLPNLTESDLKRIAEQEEILLIRDTTNGKIAAAYHMMDAGHACDGRRIVVDSAYRGRELGKLVLYSMLRFYIQRGYQNWISYIDEDNTASWNLHGKIAQKTGLVAEQYILR